MRSFGLLLVAATAWADTSAPPSQTQSLPWFERCHDRLEAKRRSWAKQHPLFADAYVKISKVNGGEDAVQLNTIDNFRRRSGFWILVHDQPVHPMADETMMGFAGWEQMRSVKPLGYPAIVRHLHPRSARMQSEPWVPRDEWDAFRAAWQPLVDACLRDALD